MVGKILIALALMVGFQVVGLQVAVTQVTQADKTLIANVHDSHRSSVQSSNMMKMRYHDAIATKAQTHPDKCVFQHNTAADRALPGLPGVYVGQNMAYFTEGKNWQYIINLWASEKQNFQLGVGSTNGSAVGHYTQNADFGGTKTKEIYFECQSSLVRTVSDVVPFLTYESRSMPNDTGYLMLWKTQAVGCGYKECPNFKLYVCNYAYGQLSWDVQHPWKGGAKCADCPNNCNNGFCDCNMQFCNSEYYIKDAKCNCTAWWDLLWWQ